ncbi:lysylphosphatidylglycerol synthase domain-containing protein [Acidocella sp. KAb 2-4]|uniref:lysylphosphatidylglycerol synthase domain-containing protein n=1 Tax=Acidocella sp. KAb 2-4 TaxID=2885158 RepID=UPI001D091A46|nr:lysylphosphatidylglycerol synthase domain-containing protein [Acidocella sp. KAb 2-4]MCB5945454.1 flippase-like domain-containing protein [Acidocella sp. KAb 2-4]
MSQKLKFLPAIFALVGVAVITILVIYFGAADVLRVLTSVSLAGFGAYTLAQLGILAGLGLCWRMLLRSHQAGSYWLCTWGRAVRDATGEFLPFSQVGGFVLGARVVSMGGVSTANAVASTLGDVTTEFLAQLVFIGIGLTILVRKAPHSELLLPIAIGLCVAVVAGVGLVLAQRGTGAKIFRALALKIAGAAGDGAAQNIDRLQTALDIIYGERGRLALSALFHLGCWFGTATASFIGFHALGVPLSFLDAICVEALLHAIMALAFFIPGRAGIQEAAYTALGGIFGVPPDVALSLSLLRRARDFVIAVPVLVIWQGLEAKKLKATV